MGIDMSRILAKSQEELSPIVELYESLYRDIFAKYFDSQHELFGRLKSKFKPVTDEELENILTMTPLNLYAVAEELNKFRLNVEVLKLRIKTSESNLKNLDKTSELWVEVNNQMIDDKLLCSVYDKLILRVESEVSFSREFIMAAKKIWDGRRQTDAVNPISPVETSADLYDNLPIY